MSKKRKPANHVPCAAWDAAQPHESACTDCPSWKECDREGYLPPKVGIEDKVVQEFAARQGLKVSAYPANQGVLWQILELR